MGSIKIETIIKSTPEVIFKYLSEQNYLMQWFAPQAIAIPLKHSVAAFAFGSDVNFKMKITEFEEYSKICWLGIDGNVDWIDSEISFDIDELNENECKIFFNHTDISNLDKIETWAISWHKYFEILKETIESISIKD